MTDADDHPHVIALPPLIYLTALIVGAIAHFLDPRPLFTWHGVFWIGIVMVLGAIIAVGAGTNVNPYEPALAVVRHGPYRLTRNPMYLAMMIGYTGVVFMINGLWPAVMIVPLLWIIGIVLIIAADGLFAVLFNIVGI